MELLFYPTKRLKMLAKEVGRCVTQIPHGTPLPSLLPLLLLSDQLENEKNYAEAIVDPMRECGKEVQHLEGRHTGRTGGGVGVGFERRGGNRVGKCDHGGTCMGHMNTCCEGEKMKGGKEVTAEGAVLVFHTVCESRT